MTTSPVPGLWSRLGRSLWPGPLGWPRRCALCLDWGSADLCGACTTPGAALAGRRCPRCGIGLPGTDCSTCRRRPPPVARTVVAMDYRPPWDGLILRLKFGADLALVNPLAQALADAVQAQMDPAEVDWVLPVPLHPDRLRQRGYNQAWLLARATARRLRRPALADGLVRWRATEAQAALDLPQRAGNVQAAFMANPAHAARLRGRTVALVDDVMTTGATAYAAARAAQAVGVRTVHLWVVARTPEPDRTGPG